MGLSRLSSKCQSCPFLDICSNKEREQVECLKEPIAADAGQSITVSTAAPILREAINICIDGNTLTVYKDDIEKALCEELFSDFRLQGGR